MARKRAVGSMIALLALLTLIFGLSLHARQAAVTAPRSIDPQYASSLWVAGQH